MSTLVCSLDDAVFVTAVGAGMREAAGVSTRLFPTLGQSGINVISGAHGSSAYNMSLIVDATDAAGMIRRIHKEVILNG